MHKRKNKLQGYDTLVSTFVLLSEKEVLDKLDKMDKVQVKSTHYYKGQLVLDIELSEVYKGTDSEYFK